MKALVMTKPGEFALEDRPRPVPGNGEVLFKVLRAGVCGTDLHAFEGTQPFFSYPRIVGHELAVQVAEIPASAKDSCGVKEGDIVSLLPYLCCGGCVACRNGKTNCCTSLKCLGVHTDGGMQEYLCLPARYAVPAGRVKPEDIALVECFSIGFHGARRANPRPGETALVVGAGPIGIGAIHGLKERGVKTIVMDINEKRLAYAKETAKADYTINSLNAADPEKAVADIAGGELPPLVMDATGNAGQMMKAPNYVCAGGTVVFVGLVRADLSFHDPLLHAKELTIMASRNACREDFANVIAGIESGRVNTSGFVTHTASLEETPARFASWLKPETGCIKAVVSVAP